LPTVDDILATYARLKGLGIEPVLTAHHRSSTAFYYEDPDRNSVELTVDNFGDW
jgi:catechol 2,3-dioxygenase